MSTDDAGAARSNRRAERVVIAILVVALVAALVALVVLVRDRDRLEKRADQAADAGSRSTTGSAEQAARAAVEAMTTYDHRTVEEDFAWVEDLGTPAFEETFAGAASSAIDTIRRLRSRAEGNVVDSAATVEDDDRVKVLLFVDQALEAPGERPRLEESRVTMRMVRQDGRWLVDEVQLLNLAGP